MNPRSLRTVLYSLAILLLTTATGLVCYWLEQPLPLIESTLTSRNVPEKPNAKPKPKPVAVSLSDLEPHLELRLQRPLVDPPSPAALPVVEPVAAPVPVAPLLVDLNLVGTIHGEGGDGGRAWVELKGKQHGVRSGEVLLAHPQQPRLIEVEDRRVVFEVEGQEVPITMKGSSILNEIQPHVEPEDG